MFNKEIKAGNSNGTCKGTRLGSSGFTQDTGSLQGGVATPTPLHVTILTIVLQIQLLFIPIYICIKTSRFHKKIKKLLEYIVYRIRFCF